MDAYVDLSPSHVRAFLDVVETGSFSEAARRRGVAQSTVSRSVAALEAALGARLVQRTTRRVEVTEAGEALVGAGRRILAECQDAFDEVQSLHGRLRGVLRVGAPAAYARRHLVPLLPPFVARYPELTLDLVFSTTPVELLRAGVDLAIHVGPLPDSTLVARRIGMSEHVAVASPEYATRHGRAARLTDLTSHRCLVMRAGDVRDRWTFDGPEGTETVRVPHTMVAEDAEVLLSLALAGLGVTVLPTYIAQEALDRGELVSMLEGHRGLPFPIHAVWAAGSYRPRKVGAFLELLA